MQRLLLADVPYDRSFFERPVDDVAHDLVGTTLVLYDADLVLRARVVETEAYGGSDDPASHAFRGPTQRCAVMFGPAGFLYVYRIYGMHWCMNVVTGEAGEASAVLLRAAELRSRPVDGAESQAESTLLRGPGNLTRGLGVTGADNGLDCCHSTSSRIAFCATTEGTGARRVGRSPRIGISKERERPSRYFLEDHPAVSRVPAGTRQR
jgi:DNA-3-methyladenine glycosylase